MQNDTSSLVMSQSCLTLREGSINADLRVFWGLNQKPSKALKEGGRNGGAVGLAHYKGVQNDVGQGCLWNTKIIEQR